MRLVVAQKLTADKGQGSTVEGCGDLRMLGAGAWFGEIAVVVFDLLVGVAGGGVVGHSVVRFAGARGLRGLVFDGAFIQVRIFSLHHSSRRAFCSRCSWNGCARCTSVMLACAYGASSGSPTCYFGPNGFRVQRTRSARDCDPGGAQ